MSVIRAVTTGLLAAVALVGFLVFTAAGRKEATVKKEATVGNVPTTF